MEENKSLKEYCREAKKRLKQGFWQNYHKSLEEEIAIAEKSGVSASKVKEYFAYKVTDGINSVNNEEEEFYCTVKKLLDEEGEVSNAIGRLTDREKYQKLTYEEQQRYNLSLSERYLKAVERYNKEKELEYKL